MAHYLLVLHDLDESPELVSAAREMASKDAAADFVLLVPAVMLPLDALMLPDTNSIQLARQRAQRGRGQLLAAGLNLVATRLGNSSPLRALDDALRFTSFAEVVIASPPHPILHLLRRDLACRAVKRFPGTPVLHAPAGGPSSSDRAGLRADSFPSAGV